VVALVAAIAPMLVAALPERWRVPQVVVLIFSGILIGPHVLGLSETSSVKLLANIGLGFLFLLAGYELDLRLLAAHEGRLAMIGWVVSAVISLVAVAGLTKAGFVRDFIPIALALTTTALGTLLPILSDNEMLRGQFGRYVLLGLLALAERFGLDVVLGAVLAGMVLRTWLRREDVDVHPLEEKLDAVGYGIFIPIFFVTSGMTLDVPAMVKDPLRVLIFLGLLLVVRGLPSLVVYRRSLPRRQRVEMTFITATTLPLLIALTEIGLQDGVMLPANAAAIVGAGVLSVLIYPAVAVGLARRDRWETGSAGPIIGEPGVATAADGAWGADGPLEADGLPGRDGSPGMDRTPGIEEAPGAPAG